MTKGTAAEQLVRDRLWAAFPADYHRFPNVAWLQRTADNRGLRDGEADVVVAHPGRGFKSLERRVIVLLELKPDDKPLERLLYIGASRAKQHLVLIAPPGAVA